MSLRLLLCGMVLLLGASIGHGLSAPDTILLPDSLGPLRPPYHLAYGGSSWNIYVASESSDIIVVDGKTFQRIERIYTHTPVGGALLVAQHERLYCSCPAQGHIAVIDCATNSIVGSILVGRCPTLLCYASGSDKLYCGDTIDGTVTVIDCTNDAVLKVVPAGGRPTAMAYDSTTSQIFAATNGGVTAISCSADSVVASISAVKNAIGLLVNQRRQKLYMVTTGLDTAWHVVCVASTVSDSVLDTMRITRGDIHPRLACNEATDRLYEAESDGDDFLREFDCSGDTYIRGIDLWPYTAPAIACDTKYNRLFDLSAYDLVTLECESLDIVSNITMDDNYHYPAVLELDPAQYRAMCAGFDPEAGRYEGEGVLAVFDYKHDTTCVRGATPLCGWKGVMCENPVTRKLYFHWGTGVGGVGVIDEQTNHVVAQTSLSEGSGIGMAYSRTSNKYYYWAENGIGVMDGSTDRFLKVINVGNDVGWNACPCWCEDGNKVYCFASNDYRMYIAVIDCNTDSVIKTMDVTQLIKWFDYLGGGRILCYMDESLMLIDCLTDNVLVDSTTIGCVLASTHSAGGDKAYILRTYGLEVRSPNSLSPLATIAWPSFHSDYGSFLAYSDSTQKLYWVAEEQDSVLAIDASSDTVAAHRKFTLWCMDEWCFDHTGRYLFYTTYYDSTLNVCDTKSDSVVAVYTHLPYPICITSSPENHRIYVGCRSLILSYPDAPPGVAESPNPEARTTNRIPTVVRGVLFLPKASSLKPHATSLMDATGRKVLDLRPGANDVRALAPGVYFVRTAQAQAQAQAVSKVVVTR